MCKVSYKIIKLFYTSFIVAVVALACFILIPSGSASAAAYEYNYLYEFSYITDVFPQGYAMGANSKYPSEVRFYEGDEWSWSSGQSYRVTFEKMFFDSNPSFSHIAAYGDNSLFKAKSATVQLNTCITDLVPGRFYVFDFTLKFDNDNRICTAENIYNLNLEHRKFDSSDTPFKVAPVKVWTSGAHAYAHFNYVIDGKWFNGHSVMMFYFRSNVGKWQDCRIWFDPSMPFTVREQTEAEAQADLTADALWNFGSDQPDPDISDTTNKTNDMISGFNQIEDNYKIDADDAKQTLSGSSKLFEDATFISGFRFINDQINRFTGDNTYIYLFFITILGLGIAFAALGRSL